MSAPVIRGTPRAHRPASGTVWPPRLGPLAACVLAAVCSLGRASAQGLSPWEYLTFCTERVTVATGGTQSDGESIQPSLSADGRLLVFGSLASNLDPGDDNENWDAFVHERDTHSTRRVSFSVHRSLDGALGVGDTFLSADGSAVTFAGRASYDAPGGQLLCAAGSSIRMQECIFVRDLGSGALSILDVRPDGVRGNGYSRWPTLSADGRFASFWSTSSDLVDGDGNDTSDVFRRDRLAATTSRSSVASDGSEGDRASGNYGGVGADATSISRSGRWVVYPSNATNLGPGDTDALTGVFVHDHQDGTTESVALATDGGPANGRSYLGGRQAISDDGRYVVFASTASNLVADDTAGQADVFVRDRLIGRTERVSVSSDLAQGNGPSGPLVAISADGRFVAFNSLASNLVADDTNGLQDIFVRDRFAGSGRTIRVSVANDGEQANGENGDALWRGLSMTADGLTIAWSSTASNLVAEDTNGVRDAFVRWPCVASPTATPTASIVATLPPSATPTPTASRPPSATPTSTAPPTPAASCVCKVVRDRVPAVVITDALSRPGRYYGWRYPLDPGKPPGPANPRRECLTLMNAGLPYHPLWNRPQWRVGCP